MALAGLTRDLGLKVFSVFVAGLLFVFVSVESGTPVDVDYRIEYRTDEDIQVVGDPPMVLHATLKGPWAAVWAFNIEHLDPVVIDLTDLGPGTTRHRIDVAEIHNPGGMKVVAVRPSEVEVVLDRRIERQVAVNADVVSKPALGFEVVNIRVVPPRVRVVGPQNAVQSLDYVHTRPIDLTDHQDTLEVDVPLRPPPIPLRLSESLVHVTVEIAEEVIERRFDNVPVELSNAPEGSNVSPKTVAIDVRGPRRAIESIDAEKMVAVLDVAAEAHAAESRFEKTVEIARLPEQAVQLPPKPKVVVELKLPRRKRR